MKIEISISRQGLPCVFVGGGGYTNTYQGKFVLRQGKLAPAIFIKERGDLASRIDQAIVPVQKDDLVIEISGSYPINPENPDTNVSILKIISISGTEAEVEEVTYEEAIPESVVKGMKRYHNREGDYFCMEVQK